MECACLHSYQQPSTIKEVLLNDVIMTRTFNRTGDKKLLQSFFKKYSVYVFVRKVWEDLALVDFSDCSPSWHADRRGTEGCTLGITLYCAGDKIEKNEMGWACGVYG